MGKLSDFIYQILDLCQKINEPDTTQTYLPSMCIAFILGQYNVLVIPGTFRLKSKKSSRPTSAILCEKSKYLLISINYDYNYLFSGQKLLFLLKSRPVRYHSITKHVVYRQCHVPTQLTVMH